MIDQVQGSPAASTAFVGRRFMAGLKMSVPIVPQDMGLSSCSV